ncbi:MAG: hypothetical protein RBT76_04990 [candidate division Zixibacteria bacterium]|nr:hypothetical protein [candidate division Zixibacteria bacterium]
MKFLGSLLLVLSLVPATFADTPWTFELSAPRQAAGSAAEPPDTGLVTNSAVDIVLHDGAVWLGTSKGLMFTYDAGQTWLRYDQTNGLVSANLSALFSAPGGDRLWIGSNHDELVQDQLFSISDGVSFSPDNGDTWTQVDFGTSGLNIPFVTGGNRQVFDFTGMNRADLGGNWRFFAAFAGGLLASQDGGDGWRRIFPTPSDSVQFYTPNAQPSLRNRYFSCISDTAHTDSVFLWAGTAAGIFQYVWVKPGDKLYNRTIRSVAFCDTCSVGDRYSLFIGGNLGLSRGRFTGGPFDTKFEADGLPGEYISALGVFEGRLLLGILDLPSLTPILAYSDDQGETFTDITPASLTDSVTAFERMGDRLYMTAGAAGLYVSSDTGLTWQRILFDSLDAASPVNAANALEVMPDTLRIGTDSGFVTAVFDAAGSFTQPPLINADTVFVESLRRSQRVVGIRTQRLAADTITWLLCHPATAQGTAVLLYTDDGGIDWDGRFVDSVMTDIEIVNDTLYVVGEEGIFYNVTGQGADFVTGSITAGGLSLSDDSVLTVVARDSQLVFGTNRSLALSTQPDSVRRYSIHRANFDTLTADLNINYNFDNTLLIDTGGVRVGLTGDFIPALDIQYRQGGQPPRLWASGRPVSSGGNGISVARFNEVEVVDTLGTILDTIVEVRWRGVHFDDFAWNFAFDDEVVFAACNSGLLMKDMSAADSLDNTWDTVRFAGTDEVFVNPGTPVYAVEVIDNYLWAGTADGTVRINLDDFFDQRRFHYTDESAGDDEVYAFPTPFRPDRGEELDFHFTVVSDAYVTLEIFDFAMNLVATPIDDVFLTAGIYHGGTPSGAQGITWNGRNDEGDLVAVGVYYFKVTYSTGEVHWGKLAVIP